MCILETCFCVGFYDILSSLVPRFGTEMHKTGKSTIRVSIKAPGF